MPYILAASSSSRSRPRAVRARRRRRAELDVPEDGAGRLDARPRCRSPATAPRAAATGELPNTGSDPRLLFLAGLALTLLGAGLRLRTADADLY